MKLMHLKILILIQLINYFQNELLIRENSFLIFKDIIIKIELIILKDKNYANSLKITSYIIRVFLTKLLIKKYTK